MKQLFLAPRANETAYDNFQSTIAQGVPYSRVEPYLDEEDRKVLGEYETLYVWGTQPRSKVRWDKMNDGDYILFYKDSHFVQASEVLHKIYSDDLALEMWPPSEDTGLPWSCLYFVHNIRPINLHIKEFNEYADYELRAVMGFMRVTEPHTDEINATFGSLDRFIESLVSGLSLYEITTLEKLAKKGKLYGKEIDEFDMILRDNNYEDVLAEIKAQNMDKKPEEVERKVKSINRNYKLVEVMKKKHGYKCQVCGFTFKTESGSYYCEAAHIKPLSTREEGVDTPENVVILCPNHHKMLDRGALEITSEGNFIIEGVEKRLL